MVNETQAELDIDRWEAERHPCPYVDHRRRDKDGNQVRCGAGIGEQCRNTSTGRPLNRQPAHLPRLKLAGRT